MEILIVVLIVVLIGLVALALWFMYFKKEPAPKANGDTLVSAASVMKVRTAEDGSRKLLVTFEIDENDIVGNEPAPFLADAEGEFVRNERTDIERFRDPSISAEERYEIGLSLKERGYKVVLPEVPGRTAPQEGGAAGENDDNEGEEGQGEDDLSAETDIDKLSFIMSNPSVSEERREEARRRLEQLQEESGGKTEETNEETGGEPDAGAGDEYYGTGYVNPDDYYSPEEGGEPGEPEESSEEEDPEAGEEDEDEGEKDPDEGGEPEEGNEEGDGSDKDEDEDEKEVENVLELTITKQYDDDSESVRAISLMTFIARSYKKNLISPELVLFAEDRLNLQMNPSYWKPEDRIRARQRRDVYERNPEFAGMNVFDLDATVRGIVASEEAARAAEKDMAPAGTDGDAGAPLVSDEEPERISVQEKAVEPKADAVESVSGPVAQEEAAAAEPVKAKDLEGTAKPRRVSTFFDAHGGKNDLMWARLERSEKK